MKHISIKFLILIMMIFPTISFSKDCTDGAGFIGMYLCLQKQLNETDEEVNGVYENLKNNLDDKYVSLLVNSQTAWEAYRSAQCDLTFEADDPSRKALCKLKFAKERLEYLKSIQNENCTGCLSEQ